jgi:hypothetical protein
VTQPDTTTTSNQARSRPKLHLNESGATLALSKADENAFNTTAAAWF